MVDLTEYFSKFAMSTLPHGTLNGIIKNKLNEQQKNKRKNYFSVTDICNPLQTYFKLKYPEKFKDSIETKKRFSLGKRQHWITKKKFEKIDGFVDSEIILDGELIGIPLKGRADAKIKESFWELKSTTNLPENVQELIERIPQGIEQLSFYSLLSSNNPKENYLVITTQSDSNEYKVFKINILDSGKIKNIALNRVTKINEWLDGENEPEVSQKCRYCYENCVIKKEGLCSHFEKESLPCEIKDFIEIEEVPQIEELLKGIKLFDADKTLITYAIYNLITPRKIIHQENNQEIEEEEYDNEEKRENKQFIQDILYRLDCNVSFEDWDKIKKRQKIKEIYQNKASFIKFISNGEEKIFPILIHISDSIYPSSLIKVSDYKKAELGIHCLNNDSTKGYLIVYFPKQNNEIRVFEISYNFERESLNKLKNIVEIINNKDKSRLKELPKCPSFIHENCVYKEVCVKD
jgi:hypothetical protein